jgi:hypothetical protein
MACSSGFSYTETVPPTCVTSRRRFFGETTGEREGRSYKVGDKVVYPHHGAGTVVKKEEREVLGQQREYLTIKILHNDMTVNVPCENVEKVGLRKVIDEAMVEQVVKANTPDEKVVNDAYLTTLCRQPTDSERGALLKVLGEAKENRREAIEDLYWSLLSSKEFLFNR